MTTDVRSERGFAAHIAAPYILAFAMLAFEGSAQAEILQNGSFEAPILQVGQLTPTSPTGWTGGGFHMRPAADGTLIGDSYIWPQAPMGNQYADIGNQPAFALSQTFLITTPGEYLFSWYDNTALNIVAGQQFAPYQVALTDASASVIFSHALDSYDANGNWQSRSISHTLDPGSFTLSFTSLNQPFRTDTVIDAVAITAVPEPQTIALVIVGVILVACTKGVRLQNAGDA